MATTPPDGCSCSRGCASRKRWRSADRTLISSTLTINVRHSWSREGTLTRRRRRRVGATADRAGTRGHPCDDQAGAGTCIGHGQNASGLAEPKAGRAWLGRASSRRAQLALVVAEEPKSDVNSVTASFQRCDLGASCSLGVQRLPWRNRRRPSSPTCEPVFGGARFEPATRAGF
jgi:hypothetical protein